MSEDFYLRFIQPGILWVLVALLLGAIVELLQGRGVRKKPLTPEEKAYVEKVRAK